MDSRSDLRESRLAARAVALPAADVPPFCRTGYRALLDRFRAAGYETVKFDKVERQKRHLIVRHDIDLCIDAAVHMAEIERDMNVSATYFIMVSNPFYNIFTRETKAKLRRLVKLGHCIGLHFALDAHVSAGDDNALSKCHKAILFESEILRTVVESTVDIVSFHKPLPAVMRREHPIGGRPHTYEPRFISEIEYVSDSRGAWRFGHPFARPAFAAGTAMHLLVHPIWWDREIPVEPEVRLKEFAAKYLASFEGSLATHCEPYQKVLGERRRT